jgi:hypothetical protein
MGTLDTLLATLSTTAFTRDRSLLSMGGLPARPSLSDSQPMRLCFLGPGDERISVHDCLFEVLDIISHVIRNDNAVTANPCDSAA